MMNRRNFLASLVAPAARTNLVLILADDFGWRDLGCYGNEYFATPQIDRLAAEGARFTNAYAACPVCSPTRASLMTGKYPVRTGVTDWIPGRPSHEKGPVVTPRTATELRLEEVTLAERLKEKGYRSASVGKWHLGGAGYGPREQGFDVNIGGTHSGSPPPSPKPYAGPFELPGLKLAAGEGLTERLTEEAVGWMDRTKDPYFLYLSHFTVHIPLGAREDLVARHRAKAQGRYNPVYAAMVETLDASVGRVLEAIERSGQRENTVVAFFSDNGGLRFEGQAKAAVTDNAPLRAGKGHLYEGGIREPLIVRYPRMVASGQVLDTPVSSVDLFPTFCGAAGVEPGAVDGVDLLPLLRGGRPPKRELYWHYPHYSNQGGEPGGAVRDGDWKLIEFYADGRRELFHLKDDPGETRNLVKKEAGRARALGEKLAAWRQRCGAVMPTKNPAMEPGWPGWGLTGAERATPVV